MKLQKIETITAVDISLYIIHKLAQNNIYITNMKLQLILYCIFKEFLKHGIIPFSDNFVATIYGPKIHSVYNEFCNFVSSPIYLIKEPKDNISQEYKDIINKVLDVKIKLDVYQLSQENKDKAYNLIFNSQNKDKTIPLELIKASFEEEILESNKLILQK